MGIKVSCGQRNYWTFKLLYLRYKRWWITVDSLINFFEFQRIQQKCASKLELSLNQSPWCKERDGLPKSSFHETSLKH